jgi:hypothetical protein
VVHALFGDFGGAKWLYLGLVIASAVGFFWLFYRHFTRTERQWWTKLGLC